MKKQNKRLILQKDFADFLLENIHYYLPIRNDIFSKKTL